MMKYVVLLALSLFTSLSGWAFSLDNADIRLLCPQRGQIEVILHRYEHTQQSWGQHHFETGGGQAVFHAFAGSVQRRVVDNLGDGHGFDFGGCSRRRSISSQTPLWRRASSTCQPRRSSVPPVRTWPDHFSSPW